MGDAAKVGEVQAVVVRDTAVVKNFTVAGKTPLGHPEWPSLTH